VNILYDAAKIGISRRIPEDMLYKSSLHGDDHYLIVQMIYMDLFYRYLKRHCHSDQFCEKNCKLPSLVALALQDGKEYRYINVCINNVNDASISCKTFVYFNSVAQVLTELICEHLV